MSSSEHPQALGKLEDESLSASRNSWIDPRALYVSRIDWDFPGGRKGIGGGQSRDGVGDKGVM